eukprot:scaffold37450_cov33-Prasinocladus_malaysianus.AAC.1
MSHVPREQYFAPHEAIDLGFRTSLGPYRRYSSYHASHSLLPALSHHRRLVCSFCLVGVGHCRVLVRLTNTDSSKAMYSHEIPSDMEEILGKGAMDFTVTSPISLVAKARMLRRALRATWPSAQECLSATLQQRQGVAAGSSALSWSQAFSSASEPAEDAAAARRAFVRQKLDEGYTPAYTGQWNDEWLEALRVSNQTLPLKGQV